MENAKMSFGLLGERLSHSFSPMLHNMLGDDDYRLFEVKPEAVDSFLNNRNFLGLNVTIPYKKTVMPYCSSISDEARRIGSINTITVSSDGSLKGYNTDYFGFCSLLAQEGISVKGKKTAILGNGGAAAMVKVALADLGAESIAVISRSGEYNYTNLERNADVQVIVNTTPVGMYPGNGETPVRLSCFPECEAVADLIYNPQRTALLLDAERLGIKAVGGLGMLVGQAVEARRLFTGATLFEERTSHGTEPAGCQLRDIESGSRVETGCRNRICSGEIEDNQDSTAEYDKGQLIARLTKKLQRRMQNIVLIGMPGCGKSSVGKRLARRLGRDFIDIDKEIEAKAGRTIPEIFAADGEDCFRRLETECMRAAGALSGKIIAAGGGVVKRQENCDLIRQNSFVILLDRKLAELDMKGRPLSTDRAALERMYAERLPYYKAWSDMAVKTGDTVADTVKRVAAALN